MAKNWKEKVRSELYSVLDEMELFDLEGIIEDTAQEYKLNDDVLFTCPKCRDIYGECGETIDTEVCRERFEQYHSERF